MTATSPPSCCPPLADFASTRPPISAAQVAVQYILGTTSPPSRCRSVDMPLTISKRAGVKKIKDMQVPEDETFRHVPYPAITDNK
ncbi:hypothetical protein VE03_10437, partial [Pseudogymnoascus sp. 23342-1-I1]